MACFLFVGVDVGSSRAKVAILDRDRAIVGKAVRKSGTDFAASAELTLIEALAEAGAGR